MSDWPVRQEPEMAKGGHLVVIGVVSIIVGAIGVFFAGVIVVGVAGSLRPSAAGPQGSKPAPTAIASVLQTPIWDAQEGIDMRRRQRAELEKLGWANRAGGMARIPIEDAIDMVVEEQQP